MGVVVDVEKVVEDDEEDDEDDEDEDEDEEDVVEEDVIIEELEVVEEEAVVDVLEEVEVVVVELEVELRDVVVELLVKLLNLGSPLGSVTVTKAVLTESPEFVSYISPTLACILGVICALISSSVAKKTHTHNPRIGRTIYLSRLPSMLTQTDRQTN